MTPGQADNAQSNLHMADQALRAARLLLDAGAREDAASRLNYAVFHAAHAALMVRGRYAIRPTGAGHRPMGPSCRGR
ncbi:MAG: HEPN domain-containing protein [Acidimicrobiales bacterium]